MNISPLGWLHALGSLPAIPLAIYMLVKHGRITPETTAGQAYFWFMVLGAVTVYPIAHQSVSLVIATFTIAVLLVGDSIPRWSRSMRFAEYAQTILLSLSVFLLLVPTVSETLRRLPVGDPIAKGLNDPLLLAVQGVLFFVLIIGIVLQVRAIYNRKEVLS